MLGIAQFFQSFLRGNYPNGISLAGRCRFIWQRKD
jgi:hypothetical protein